MYTPNNLKVYTQAFAGSAAGLLGQSTPLTTVEGSFIPTLKIAGAWAQEVDTQWGSSLDPDQFEFAEIFAFSNDLFEVYEPQPNTGVAGVGSSINPATYTPTAEALLILLADGETYLASQGITPGQIANALNFVGMQNAVAIHTQTQSSAGTLVALAAVAVQSKISGLFQYDIDVCFADGTTAKTVELRAVLVPIGAVPKAFTQSAGAIDSTNPHVGPSYIPVPVGDLVAQLNQDSTGLTASGLLSGGTAPVDTVANAQILWDQEVDTLTGELAHGDAGFHAHGVAGYTSAGVPSPGFGLSNWAVLVLELVSTNGGDVITFGAVTMSLREVG